MPALAGAARTPVTGSVAATVGGEPPGTALRLPPGPSLPSPRPRSPVRAAKHHRNL